MLQAKPALKVDFSLAFRRMPPKMKVQTHREIPHCSPDSSHLVHGPIPEHCLAVNVALTDRTKIAAVVRQTAMVAQHKITVRRNYDFGVRSLVFVGTGHVVFLDRRAIHEDAAGIDLDAIPRQPNHPFDKALRRIPWITKNDDVATLDRLQPVDK